MEPKSPEDIYIRFT
uniref:Uncharacterized protein n=1 Tax=Arundo donax TaxID=35708 RepID=A0A0A8Z8N9_ARUDO